MLKFVFVSKLTGGEYNDVAKYSGAYSPTSPMWIHVLGEELLRNAKILQYWYLYNPVTVNVWLCDKLDQVMPLRLSTLVHKLWSDDP